MEIFKQIFEQISTVFKWWVIVHPWEEGLKFWLGKNHRVLKAGIHFRIPYLHSIYVQPVRIQFINLSPQTLTTKSGDTLTIAIIVGYSITDIYKAYCSVGELVGAITAFVTGNIAAYVSTIDSKEVSISQVENHIKTGLKSTDWGVDVSEVRVTSFAFVKTFRLIQDNHWMGNGHELDKKL